MDTCQPWWYYGAEQVEGSHKDARCLLEPDPRGELAREGRIRISGDIITLERVI